MAGKRRGFQNPNEENEKEVEEVTMESETESDNEDVTRSEPRPSELSSTATAPTSSVGSRPISSRQWTPSSVGPTSSDSGQWIVRRTTRGLITFTGNNVC